MRPNKTTQEPLAQLLSHPDIWCAEQLRAEHSLTNHANNDSIPSGFSALNQALPLNGWPTKGAVEILSSGVGQGSLYLVTPLLAQLSQQQRYIAWIAPPQQPFAPSLAGFNIDIAQQLIVVTKTLKECLWATETCLQSGQCGAVLSWPTTLTPTQVKRLHLAGQKGSSLALIMRPDTATVQTSPAPLRIQVKRKAHNTPHQLNVKLIKRRGLWPSDWLTVTANALESHRQ